MIDRYRKAGREAKIAADAQAAISAKMEDIRADAKQIAREVAAGHPDDIIDLVEAYLTQVPAAITQSLKRADDPSGTTLPFGFAVSSAEDVAKMLPPRVPRFRPNMPVPGKAGWTLDRLLGVGGFGEVWYAKHDRMASLVGAIKFCFGQTGRDLIHEADLIDRVMQAGTHPNIVPLKDVHLDGDAPWIMFEYVGGGTLTDWIHSLAGKSNEDRLPQVLSAIKQLADAVAFFHALERPLVHRDLKPSNILLDRVTKKLRITDFGIGAVAARESNRQESRGESSRGGRLLSYLRGSHTPTYSSPQQRRGDAPDPRDDVHALGVIAYQMLTGKLDSGPGTGATRALKRMGVGDDVAELLLRCASEELEDRPRHAGELLAELASVGERRDVSPPVAPSPAAVPQPERLSPPAQASGLGNGAEVASSLKGSLTGDGATLSGSKPVLADSPGRSPGLKETALRAEDKPLAVPVVPLVPRVRKAGDRHEIPLPGGAKMAFAWCPPGTFLMGSPSSEKERGDNETQHAVTLTKGFWMGIHPVTQAQWRAVMGTDPSHFKGDTLPVERVSWDDTQAFCRDLKQQAGVELRMPTEAEWEYAARGGTMTPFYFGSVLDGAQANCNGINPYGVGTHGPSLETTTPVGNYAAKYPSPWGLTDMLGNVWEWCADWYGAYTGREIEDPTGSKVGGSSRVRRGGGWNSEARYCRAACRGRFTPLGRRSNFGFRLAADASAFSPAG